MRPIIPVLLLAALAPAAAQTVDDPVQPDPYVKLTHPEWSRNAAIYQVNIRQFTRAGTFAAAERELPRLRDLGVRILWLMPIHPIGEKNRKGTLGSPYSVRDHFGVNPEFGTLADLESFVERAHELGLYVILDWVANHTAWDHPLVEAHPEWYERDWKGDFRPTPWWDWTDIIDLDYSQPGVRRYMLEALEYWVREAGVDGYRCDVAGYIPVEFWDEARRRLDAIRPVFMLAEWESRDLHARAFDMTYSWSWHDALHDVARGDADVMRLHQYYAEHQSAFPPGGMRMNFLTNHDKNAWEYTEFEAFGDALPAAIVLSVVSEGTPMLYNGQEAGNEKRLEFFERDPIEWRDHENGKLYRKMIALKTGNTALWNAGWGAPMIHVPNDRPSEVFSFVRRNDADKVFAIFNFSPESQDVGFEESLYHGMYEDYPAGRRVELDADTRLSMAPWSYRVFVRP